MFLPRTILQRGGFALAAVLLIQASFPSTEVRAQTAVGLLADGGRAEGAAAVSVVGNPGEFRLVFDRVEAVFNNRIVPPATANLGFVWDMSGDAACADGLNNDDHTVLGAGRQDTQIDFPADAECLSLDDASEDKAGIQERRPVVFAGTVDGDGRVNVPSTGIDIPPVWAWSSSDVVGGDGVRTYEFEPVGSAVGILNPFTRDLGLHLRFRIRVSVDGGESLTGPGDHCYVGSIAEPIAIRLGTIEARSEAGLPKAEGAAYDAASGSLELVGYNIADAAAASDCGAFGSLNEVVGAAFGVPSAPGNIRLSAKGRIEPVPVAAPDAEPTMVRLPRDLFPHAQFGKHEPEKSDAVAAPAKPDSEGEAHGEAPEETGREGAYTAGDGSEIKAVVVESKPKEPVAEVVPLPAAPKREPLATLEPVEEPVDESPKPAKTDAPDSNSSVVIEPMAPVAEEGADPDSADEAVTGDEATPEDSKADDGADPGSADEAVTGDEATPEDPEADDGADPDSADEAVTGDEATPEDSKADDGADPDSADEAVNGEEAKPVESEAGDGADPDGANEAVNPDEAEPAEPEADDDPETDSKSPDETATDDEPQPLEAEEPEGEGAPESDETDAADPAADGEPIDDEEPAVEEVPMADDEPASPTVLGEGAEGAVEPPDSDAVDEGPGPEPSEETPPADASRSEEPQDLLHTPGEKGAESPLFDVPGEPDAPDSSLPDAGRAPAADLAAAQPQPRAPRPRILGNVPPPSGFPDGDYAPSSAPPLPPPPKRAGGPNEPRRPVDRSAELLERAKRAYGQNP